MTTSLQGKNILVFAATGAIAGGVVAELARRGAHVHASARDGARLAALADRVGADGGKVSTEVVDASDEAAVLSYVERVGESAGSVDGVFNGIGSTPAALGYPAVSTELDLETFLRPTQLIAGSTFLTSRAAARHMVRQGSGSIVTLSASLSGTPIQWMAALTATCAAIEGMTRSLAKELGPAGVRVNCVRGDAMPETTTIQLTLAGSAALAGIDPASFAANRPPSTLGRPTTVADTAAMVAFLLSDDAAGISTQVLNVSGNAQVA